MNKGQEIQILIINKLLELRAKNSITHEEAQTINYLIGEMRKADLNHLSENIEN